MSFSEVMSEAMNNGIAAIEQAQPQLEYAPHVGNDPGVRIDLELAEATKTSLHYSALIEILGRHMALARSVVGGQ
jgi:flagellar basal-body rod protein FlgB